MELNYYILLLRSKYKPEYNILNKIVIKKAIYA